MLPRERGRVGEQLVRHRSALALKMLDDIGHIGRVPISDGGDHQVHSGRSELLCILSAIGDAPLVEGADHLGQGVALFALVQPSLTALAHDQRQPCVSSST